MRTASPVRLRQERLTGSLVTLSSKPGVEHLRLVRAPGTPAQVGQREQGVTPRERGAVRGDAIELVLDRGQLLGGGGDLGACHQQGDVDGGRGPPLLERDVEVRDPGPVGVRGTPGQRCAGRRSRTPARTSRPRRRRTSASARPARTRCWSHRDRSISSRVRATPCSSTRPGLRARPSRMTARRPWTSVSSGKVAASTSAIDSACPPLSARASGGSNPTRWATVNMPATQSRTTGNRGARSAAVGTRNSPRAAASAFLARVSRAAAVAVSMPRCVAICATLSPHTTRRARTIDEPGPRASSQATNSRASRSSSPWGRSSRWSGSMAAIASSGASLGIRHVWKTFRRRWSSIPARLATLTHHAARSSTSWCRQGPGGLASAAYSSASSRLPVHAARARTMRGQATWNSWLVGATPTSWQRAPTGPAGGSADREALRHSTLTPAGEDHWLLDGEKGYSTGALFADWIPVLAHLGDDGPMHVAWVDAPRRRRQRRRRLGRHGPAHHRQRHRPAATASRSHAVADHAVPPDLRGPADLRRLRPAAARGDRRRHRPGGARRRGGVRDHQEPALPGRRDVERRRRRPARRAGLRADGARGARAPRRCSPRPACAVEQADRDLDRARPRARPASPSRPPGRPARAAVGRGRQPALRGRRHPVRARLAEPRPALAQRAHPHPARPRRLEGPAPRPLRGRRAPCRPTTASSDRRTIAA